MRPGHAGTALRELAGHSRTVFAWTVASRLTGFLRVALLAAVLGPTFFGNLFQTALFLPYLVCQMLVVSLMPAILTPHLVRLRLANEPAAAAALARRCFGLALLLFCGMALAMALAAPLILPLLLLAVDDPLIRAEQLRLGWPLLLCLAPQIPLYGIAAIGVAVQHADRRFALASAAPAFENLALVAMLVAVALVFGIGADVAAVTIGQVLALGLGATTAVGLHAAVQWWGARRAGITLVPQGGWADPTLRRVLKLALPSSGNAVLMALGTMAMLVAAGAVPGGAVALQMAINLFNLPVALGARPIAAAQLPILARDPSGHGANAGLHGQALGLTLFIAVPAALILLFMPDHVASLVAFGSMRTTAGLALLAAALTGLGLAVVGESVMIVATSAAYARHDARTPLQAMALQAAITLVGLVPVVVFADGPLRLAAIGLVYSLGTLAGAALLVHRHGARLDRGLVRSLGRDIACAGIAVGAGLASAALLPDRLAGGPVAALATLTVTALVYLGAQRLCRSAELALVLETLRPNAAGRPVTLETLP